jgi:hypothetical protein
MRTLSIITALVSLSSLPSVANAGLDLGNGVALNGVALNGITLNGLTTNGKSIQGSPVNLNSMQVLEVVLPNLQVASVRSPHRNSEQESGQGSDRS